VLACGPLRWPVGPLQLSFVPPLDQIPGYATASCSSYIASVIRTSEPAAGEQGVYFATLTKNHEFTQISRSRLHSLSQRTQPTSLVFECATCLPAKKATWAAEAPRAAAPRDVAVQRRGGCRLSWSRTWTDRRLFSFRRPSCMATQKNLLVFPLTNTEQQFPDSKAPKEGWFMIGSIITRLIKLQPSDCQGRGGSESGEVRSTPKIYQSNFIRHDFCTIRKIAFVM